MRPALLAAALAATGYALLETAFVAERNLLLPWRAGHAILFLLFLAIHGVTALVALGAARLAGRFLRQGAGALAAIAPLLLLATIHAITFQRERSHATDLWTFSGTATSLVTLAASGILLVLLVRAFRNRPRLAARAATAAGVLLMAWGALRVVGARSPDGTRPVPPRGAEEVLEARDTGQRVLILGLDGLSWDVVDPMIAAGALPGLAALAARGRTLDLETINPTFSPVIWTTVATGQDRFAHQVHDIVKQVLPGGVAFPRDAPRTAFLTKTSRFTFRALRALDVVTPSSYRSTDVQAASVFQAASEAGLSTSLAEWYVTWPAPPLSGVTVSDRFHLQLPGGDVPLAVYPDSLSGPLRRHVVPPEGVPYEQVLALLDTEGLLPDEVDDLAARQTPLLEDMRRNLARDLTTRNVAVDRLAGDTDWRLFGAYFRAVDASQHLTWIHHRAARGGPPSNDPDQPYLEEVVVRYHEIVDGIVQELLALVPQDVTVLVLSDHGFEDRYQHARAPDGVAILSGGLTLPEEKRGRLSVYDVAPTVAWILGVPLARDLARPPRTDLLGPLAGEDPPRVSTWRRPGGPRQEVPSVRSLDREEMDRLEALGYIQ